jgi:hypothetical protein
MRYIIAQRKNDNDVITHVKIDLNEEKLPNTDATKQQVIESIRLGNKYKTKINNLTSDVNVIDNKYLRSDGNNTKSDNLGNLPSF